MQTETGKVRLTLIDGEMRTFDIHEFKGISMEDLSEKLNGKGVLDIDFL